MERRPLKIARFELIYPVLALFIACNSSGNTQSTETPVISSIASVSAEPSPSGPLSLRRQIENELSAADITRKEEHTLTTKWPMSISIANFTDQKLDLDAVTAVYDTLSDLTQPKSTLNSFSYNLDGQEVTINLRPKSEAVRINSISTDIVGGNINTDGFPGRTEFSGEDIYAFAVAKDLLPGTANAYATFSFDTEACQQVIFAQVLDKNGNKMKDENILHNVQEITCNTIGHAMAARALGSSFEDYKTTVGTAPIFGHPTLAITEEMFNALPVSGPVFIQVPILN